MYKNIFFEWNSEAEFKILQIGNKYEKTVLPQ